ncbi:hypothetical protein JKG47_12400 [Acidithiobacillus sp. MC6.1]|nr:hypothetical protein [Acidithiobacillus sp. MC6.1]
MDFRGHPGCSGGRSSARPPGASWKGWVSTSAGVAYVFASGNPDMPANPVSSQMAMMPLHPSVMATLSTDRRLRTRSPPAP